MGSFLFYYLKLDFQNGSMHLNNIQKGYLGELLARDYLGSCGYRFFTENWRCRYGEIDLICLDSEQETLVFVEVKFRSTPQYGGALQAITPQKRKRLRSLVGCWWQENRGLGESLPHRFRLDAVLIDWSVGKAKPDICHLRGI